MAGKNKNKKKGQPAPNVAKLAKQVSQAMGAAAKTKQKSNRSLTTTIPPVTIGTTMSSAAPTVKLSSGGVRVSGREFVTTLPANNQTNWYLSALIPIHPAYFASTVIGNYARSYQYWRCNGFRIHYITRQPTSSTGEVVMMHVKNVSDTCPSYNSSDFLARALSTDNTILGPVWTNQTLAVKPWGNRAEVNAFTSSDINDNIYGEVMVFSQSVVTDTLGFLVIDYDFSFQSPMYTLHSSVLPIPTGVGAVVTALDFANETANGYFQTVIPTKFGGQSDGSIYKCVFNITGTAFAAGTTTSSSLQINQNGVTTSLVLADGLTLYAAQTGSTFKFYPDIVTAANQSSNAVIAYQTTVAAKTTWAFAAYLVQFGKALQLQAS